MPTLFAFDGYKINIYFDEHGIPHVHLVAADCDASIAIATGEVIIGEAPARALKTAREWIVANHVMLLNMWRK
ncbi:DUF4160 domain-containing protein [Telmatospirillum sp.]|uniref:DUF4160 domain-containing protein n=1 Tax=Telmatospirillum sp. TaxID=2079197 RepID=UPI002851FC14|nr:DUF4160 domain-containing protein [Telmatospirillum sp.]MDR3438979.1 DUF4160 domain-containing protein [Telmatospirillum sp.]